MMRSESTSAFGQPSDTKLTFGAARSSGCAARASLLISTESVIQSSLSVRALRAQCGAHRRQNGFAALLDRGLHAFRLADLAHLALARDRRGRHVRLDAELAQRIRDLFHLGGAAGAVVRHALEVVGRDLLPVER